MSDGENRRVCLITGAAGVLGTAFCKRFAGEYDIAAVYRRRRPQVHSQDYFPFDPLDPEAVNRSYPVFAIEGDVSTQAGCEKIVEATLNRFDKIDLLVNGAVTTTWAPMLGTERLFKTAVDQFVTNTIAPMRLAVVTARQFWQGRDLENRAANRNVVNLSSVAGLRLYAGMGQSVYAASKAALNTLTGHMAEEFEVLGVRVNATAANSFPSHVSTERALMAVKHLDDGDANGTIVTVDGEQDTILQVEPYNTTRV